MNLTIDKKNILLFFIAPILTCAAYAILMFALDPFALFHERVLKIGVLNNLRIQAAGAINSADFDSIILGTSILENTSAKEASSTLGGKFINISISGSTFYERGIVLDYALRQKKLKRVIYSMDAIYTNPVYEIETYPASRFDFLYDDVKWNNIYAYFDFAVAGCVFKNILGSSCMGNDYAFDRPNAWMNLPEHADRFGGLQNWLRAGSNHQIVDALAAIARDIDRVQRKDFRTYTKVEESKAIATAIAYADKDILSYAKAHPDVRFDLVFPPYSRIVFAQWYQLHSIDVPVHQALLRYLVKEAAKLPNLAIYGYEDMDFLDDIANYKDTVHFHPNYNSMILLSIRDKTHRLTQRNIESYIKTTQRKAMAYDLPGLGDKINESLKEKKTP